MNATMEMILPPAAARMEMDKRQVFFMASELKSDLPRPIPIPEILKQRPIDMCVELVVNEFGEVDSVRQIAPMEPCEPLNSPASHALLPVVISTMRSWEYIAAGICTFKTDKVECEGDDPDIRRTSIRLAYDIHFSIGGEASRRELRRQ